MWMLIRRPSRGLTGFTPRYVRTPDPYSIPEDSSPASAQFEHSIRMADSDAEARSGTRSAFPTVKRDAKNSPGHGRHRRHAVRDSLPGDGGADLPEDRSARGREGGRLPLALALGDTPADVAGREPALGGREVACVHRLVAGRRGPAVPGRHILDPARLPGDLALLAPGHLASGRPPAGR